MNDFDLTVLQTLRTFGPCSNAEIARKLEQPLHRTYKSLGVLCKGKLATHPKLQVWQITKRGVRVFSSETNRPLKVATP